MCARALANVRPPDLCRVSGERRRRRLRRASGSIDGCCSSPARPGRRRAHLSRRRHYPPLHRSAPVCCRRRGLPGRGGAPGPDLRRTGGRRSLDHPDEVLRTRACHVRAHAQWHASFPVTAESATSLASSARRKKQDLCASAVVRARGVIRAIVVWWAQSLYPALYSVLAVTACSLLCSKASELRIRGWKGTRALLSPPSRPDLQNAPARPPPPLFRSQQPPPPLPPLWPPLPPPPSLRPGDSTGAGARC